MNAPPLRLPESLSDGVIILDGHTLADAQAHWAGEDEEMRLRFEAPRRATLEEIRGAVQRWIDGRTAGAPMFTYALRSADDVLAGGCEVRWVSEPAGALNLSYWLYPQFRGRGYVARALTLLLGAVPAIEGALQIEARVDPDNVASRHVAERAGFVEQGTIVDDAAFGEGKVTRIRYVRSLA